MYIVLLTIKYIDILLIPGCLDCVFLTTILPHIKFNVLWKGIYVKYLKNDNVQYVI